MNTYHVSYTRTADTKTVHQMQVRASTLEKAVELIRDTVPERFGGEIHYVIKCNV